ncbi:unnamed protein product [Phytophthora lilii]|uniref:Unnamed protein product n=1 Tax=Phytophthora lilii TaxID=2077276 RepID=A0A9W6WNG7_9STRA|nr:unnamed protein product [Phytophthora lilii]
MPAAALVAVKKFSMPTCGSMLKPEGQLHWGLSIRAMGHCKQHGEPGSPRAMHYMYNEHLMVASSLNIPGSTCGECKLWQASEIHVEPVWEHKEERISSQRLESLQHF